MRQTITLLLAALLALPCAARKKKAAPDLWPDGTPIDAFFRDTTRVDLATLGPRYVLTDHGVSTDSTIVQTKAIQAVIDKAAAAGGGLIVVPRGTFLSGSLFFKQGTHLLVEGRLKGSDRIRDYRLGPSRQEGLSLKYFSALVNAEGLDGFTIAGTGAIVPVTPPSDSGLTASESALDGNGYAYWEEFWIRRLFNPHCTNLEALRPKLVYLSDCKNVTVQDINLTNSGFWTNHMYRCSRVRYLGCFIYAPTKGIRLPGDKREHGGPSTDAIDIDVCHDVLIDRCYMQVNDDAVVLKGGKGTWADTLSENGPVYNVMVSRCRYGIVHGCLTLGSESVHDWNIVMRDIDIAGANRVLWLKMRPDTPQKYEKVRLERISGACNSFLVVKPWTQFFEPGDRKDMPLSSCTDITIRDVNITSANFFDVAPSDKYALSRFTFLNCTVTDKAKKFDPNLIPGTRAEGVVIK